MTDCEKLFGLLSAQRTQAAKVEQATAAMKVAGPRETDKPVFVSLDAEAVYAYSNVRGSLQRDTWYRKDLPRQGIEINGEEHPLHVLWGKWWSECLKLHESTAELCNFLESLTGRQWS